MDKFIPRALQFAFLHPEIVPAYRFLSIHGKRIDVVYVAPVVVIAIQNKVAVFKAQNPVHNVTFRYKAADCLFKSGVFVAVNVDAVFVRVADMEIFAREYTVPFANPVPEVAFFAHDNSAVEDVRPSHVGEQAFDVFVHVVGKPVEILFAVFLRRSSPLFPAIALVVLVRTGVAVPVPRVEDSEVFRKFV